jgi:hypothetical protein
MRGSMARRRQQEGGGMRKQELAHARQLQNEHAGSHFAAVMHGGARTGGSVGAGGASSFFCVVWCGVRGAGRGR